jgi:acetyltransferase-like isoleucine patch superfamily enzyme
MNKRIFDTPWKIWNELWRWLAYPQVRLLFAFNGIPWERNWRFYGVPIIQKHRHSRITFGPGLRLRSSLRSNPLGPNHPVILTTWQPGAVLAVGANFGMTGGAICAAKAVIIGNNVAVGANSIIVDTDFHPLDPTQRKIRPAEAKTATVVIEDNAFIGMNCLILKGVTLGQGSLVGAGSVVTKDVPPGVIVAGNPARILKELSSQALLQDRIPIEAGGRQLEIDNRSIKTG